MKRRSKALTAVLLALSMMSLTACSAGDLSQIGQAFDQEIDERIEAALAEREIPEEEPHTYEIEERTLPLHVGEEEPEEIELAFIDGVTEIPYISVEHAAYWLKFVANTLGAADFDLTLEGDGDLLTVSRENGYPAAFDFHEDTIDFWDYDAFLACSTNATLMDLVENTGIDEEGNEAFFEHSPSSYQRYGEAITIRPGDYGVDLVSQDGKYYIPLQLFVDFFLSRFNNMQFMYNGSSVVLAGGGNIADEDAYYDVERPKERSEALIKFNYNELCLALDNLYGLKEQHSIKDFDTLFMETGLKADLLSPDPQVAGQAVWDLTFVHLDDIHSGYKHRSWMMEDEPDGEYGTSARTYIADAHRYGESREEFYPDGCPGYEEIGNTAYITFDRFTHYGIDYYKEDAQNDPEDTMGLIIYAYSQITREDSPVENVVLDMSLNGGGTATSAAYTIGAILGDGSISVKDTLTDALVTQNFKVDVNLDRKFDEEDSLLDYNLFCLIGPRSFSCGNLVPSVLKNSHVATLLGRPSGGGACVVQPMTTADGNMFQMSGPIRLAYTKNGSFYEIDQGVEPDFIITTPRQFYDREYLTKYINELVDESALEASGLSAENGATPAKGRRDILLDSDEFSELQHEVFEANHLDELLKRHDSVIFDMTDAPENDYRLRDYFYITDDVCYYESPDSAEYSFGRYYYYMSIADDDSWTNMAYGINLMSECDIRELAGYQFPPAGNEEAWSGREGEEHVACYIEDGQLYLRDRSDPELSRVWFDENIPGEKYDGQTVYSEVIADAETMEIIEFNHYLESSDGSMTRVKSSKAFYDEPEPRRVRNMRAAFERTCENTIDVTMTVDPGTDREISGSMTIPVGSNILYRCDNQDSPIIFDDAEATTLTHWDGMRDKSIYIFTDPTREQIEKYDELLKKIREEME